MAAYICPGQIFHIISGSMLQISQVQSVSQLLTVWGFTCMDFTGLSMYSVIKDFERQTTELKTHYLHRRHAGRVCAIFISPLSVP